MVKTSPLKVLTNARARGLSWRLIVDTMGELTASNSGDDQGRPWIEVAAHLTGYTTKQLHQAQKAYTTIAVFIKNQDLPSHALDWPMTNLEVISRISKLNPEKAEKLIISSTQKSWRELRRIYESLQEDPSSKASAMSAGHRSARNFNKHWSAALSNEGVLERLIGSERVTSVGSLRNWPGRYPFAHPDFVVSFHEAGTFRLAAFEGLRFHGDVNLQAATAAAMKAAVEGTFFARYYWCVSDWTPTKDLKNMRDQLGLLNVGIISASDGSLELSLPPSGEPVPNRQEMLLQDAQLRKRLRL